MPLLIFSKRLQFHPGCLQGRTDLFYKGQSLGTIAVYADGIRLDGNVRTVVGSHFALGYHADHAVNGFVLILNHGAGGSAGHKAAIRAVEPELDHIWAPNGGEPVIVRLKEEEK